MALTQQVYRIRTDATAAQGGTPVWAAVQNTNPVLSNSASFRIRFAISCITAAPASQIYNLFVSKNAGAYAQVPNVATSNPVYALDATSGASADNSALTTSLLTGATGTFSNVGEYDSDGSTAALAIPLSGYVELEFALKFNSAVVAQGDTYAFRVYQAGAVLTAYTVTPTLQVWVGEAVSKVNSYGVLTNQSLNVSKANAYAVLFSASVWSAADAAANGMTLSNGGLTATVPAGSVGWHILRSSLSKTSGKLYLEVTTSTGTVDTAHSGLASSGVNIGSYLGDSNYSFGSSILYGDLFVSTGFVTGVNSQAFKNPITSTDVLGIAVDFTTNKVWVSINNIWNGIANPSTGNSPAASFTPATVGPLFFAMSFNTATMGARDAPTTWTLQPTAASQRYAAPSGFSAWDASAVVAPTAQARALVMA